MDSSRINSRSWKSKGSPRRQKKPEMVGVSVQAIPVVSEVARKKNGRKMGLTIMGKYITLLCHTYLSKRK
jgi:hypothetical protein